MKHTLKIAASFLLLAALLCGCAVPTQVHTCQDLSITLPVSFMDLSGGEAGKDMDFFFMTSKMGITGIRMDKSSIADDAESLTAEAFLELMMYSNSHTGDILQRGDIYSYTYTAETDGEEFTYLVAALDVTDAIWLLQSYCKTAEFAKTESEMWSYLESVTIS